MILLYVTRTADTIDGGSIGLFVMLKRDWLFRENGARPGPLFGEGKVILWAI